MRIRRTLLAVLIALLVASGCGSSSDETSSEDVGETNSPTDPEPADEPEPEADAEPEPEPDDTEPEADPTGAPLSFEPWSGEIEARIQGYAGLDLTTPESALLTLGDAFAAGDYVRATLIVDVSGQAAMFRSLINIQLGDHVRTDAVAAVEQFYGDNLFGGDQWPGFLYVADLMLRGAAQEGGLLVDLTQGIADPVVEIDGETASGTATLVATGETVDVRLSLDVLRRWRVSQIRRPGGPADLVPFSGPADSPPSGPVADGSLTSMNDRWPADLTAEETADLAIDLFEAHNWIGLYELLHPDSQRMWFDAVNRFDVGFYLIDVTDPNVPSPGASAQLPMEAFGGDLIDYALGHDGFGADLRGGEVVGFGEPVVQHEVELLAVPVQTAARLLHVELLQDDSGRWRIHGIVEAGAIREERQVFAVGG